MNQQLIFNDDFELDQSKKCWKVSAILAGERIVVYSNIASNDITESQKLDVEADAEDYLEDNEPDEKGEVWL